MSDVKIDLHFAHCFFFASSMVVKAYFLWFFTLSKVSLHPLLHLFGESFILIILEHLSINISDLCFISFYYWNWIHVVVFFTPQP